MKQIAQKTQAILSTWALIFGISLTIPAQAVSYSSEATNISSVPLYIGANIPPLVMLDISKDQQLYKKAYNDYSDLDGDGQLETTYKHSIDYYGYFDSYKCYDYSTANSRFEPVSNTTTKYCAGNWSGNFLNWVAMSRMDSVRKLLYGGTRSTDTATETVLERAYIPTDAHSWAKYYNGADIAQLTPYNPPTTTPSGSIGGADNSYASAAVTIGNGTKKFRSSGITVCRGDQLKLSIDASNYMIGYVSALNSGECNTSFEITVDASGVVGAGSSTSGWTVGNLSGTGISFCNTTDFNTALPNSQTNTNPPLIKVAKGNFALWAANERWQCLWREQTSNPAGSNTPGSTRNNGNKASLSGLAASMMEPRNDTHGLPVSNGSYVARVKACVSSALLGKEKCKLYPDGNYKPIGLLQTYGDPGLLQFGLMTGSYTKNVSGGVLRKNIGPLSDEINVSTNGTFKTAPSAGNIINTLNKMRMWGYWSGTGAAAAGFYNNASPNGDSCAWQLTSITQGNCTSWGNPMSEIFYESLRYFSGKSATSAYTYTDAGSKDNSLGLPLATWIDPLSKANYCAPLNVVVFNASVSSYDDDLYTVDVSDIGVASGTTAATLANLVGDGEGITNTTRFFGKIIGTGATPSTDSGFELCSAKTVTALGQVSGICPEGPTIAGSYQMPGLAYKAHTNKIRSTLPTSATDTTSVSVSSLLPATDTKSLKVSTYGVQMATNVPQIRVAVLGETTPRVIIQPAYRLFNAPPQGGGALVDMRIVAQTSTATTASGTIYLNWEDSEQGGDYDQDMWGVLTYNLNIATNTITITTKTIAESTGSGQGFGYIITGTTKDGPHFHSGIENFSYTDPTNISVTPTTRINASGGCNVCTLGDAATTATYTLGTASAAPLNDPLWYAAKWGGFKEDSTGNGLPDQTAEWDIKTSTGANGSDNTPDNYFFVSNPLYLENALDKTFVAILASSSASSVATNSTSLNTGSRIYQARFNSNDWSGNLFSLSISTSGVVACAPPDCPCTAPSCIDSAEKVTAQDWNTSRNILTYSDSTNDGVAFRWANISTNQQTILNQNGAGVTDSLGTQRLDYLRGDASNEGTASTTFRKRSTTKLGDIINSNPQYVGPPAAGHPDSDYATFHTSYLNRTPMVYVGANDGMMHGFNACTSTNVNCTTSADQGKELLAYIPSKSYQNLSKLGEQNYSQIGSHRYFVDGTPSIEDAYININSTNQWRSVLVGGMGAGGQGIFALDVTNPTDSAQTAPTFTEANAASLALWEFTDSNDADLGYTFGQPQIAKMANGKWAAIFGNGYNSTYTCAAPCSTGPVDTIAGSGHAVLYILFIEQGIDGTWTPTTDYIKIDTNSTNLTSLGDLTNPNGMSAPFVADIDGDGKANYIYAGDLLGNMWKFDVSSSTSTSWGVAFSGPPLFTAQDSATPANRQPITTRPEVMPHPNGGYFVMFGTGKYLEKSDAANQLQLSPSCPTTTGQPCFYGQSYYAIWDQQGLTGGTAPISGTGNLLQQSVLGTVIVGVDEYRVTTSNDTSTDWSIATGKKGWYLDFPDNDITNKLSKTGERVVFNSILRGGRIIFTTLIPSDIPCKAGGDSWLMELNAFNGNRLIISPFDTDKNGVFNSSDQVTFSSQNVFVSGRKSNIGITPTPTVIGGDSSSGKPPKKEFKITSGSSGKTESIVESTGGGVLGRITWRELLGN